MKKIAIIKIGNFSFIADNVIAELKLNFPRHEFNIIDIWKDIISNYDFLGLYHSFNTYKLEILLGRKKLKTSFLYTEYFFNKVRKRLLEIVPKEKYEFTFQFQSLFDASVPGIPHFVYTDHTHLAKLYYKAHKKNHLASENWLKLEKSIYRNASAVFTMGSYIKKSLIEQYLCKYDKIFVSGGGYNIKPVADDRFNYDKYNSKTVLFVGKEWERKGGPELFDAFKKVLVRIPEAQLVIVGCNPKISHKNCKTYGKVTLDGVSEFYNKASVFCMPTRVEPFGIVFLEAFANKLPVIATNIGALPDFIVNNKNGFLVNNNTELAEKLFFLLNNPDVCQKFGFEGYRNIINEYSWSNTVKKMSEIIKNRINYRKSLT